MSRGKGATARKQPFTAHDLKMLKSVLGLTAADHLTVWRVTLIGRFFMPRMGELLASGNKNQPGDRHPLHMEDIEPLSYGGRTHTGAIM